MTTLHHALDGRCRPERLWALLSDLAAVAAYNPGVQEAQILGTAHQGVGAQRTCTLRPSGRVVERVTVWEEGRAVGLEVVSSDWSIHFMRWTTRIAPAEQGSKLTQELEYQVKFGPLGWLLDRAVMRRKLQTSLDGVLAGLIRLAEGEP